MKISPLGYCGFENGLCGLTSEYMNTTDFLWKFGSGKTLSKNTGPSFDHTTLSDKGKTLEMRKLN